MRIAGQKDTRSWTLGSTKGRKVTMKIRPYRLSQISMGDFTLVGYSVAGEESIIIAPELDE